MQQVSAKVPAQSNTYYREEGPLNILKENIEMLHAGAIHYLCTLFHRTQYKCSDSDVVIITYTVTRFQNISNLIVFKIFKWSTMKVELLSKGKFIYCYFT